MKLKSVVAAKSCFKNQYVSETTINDFIDTITSLEDELMTDTL